VALTGRVDLPLLSRCPYLQESQVQFCAAAPVVKYLPHSDVVLSPCGNDNYRYCESFLEPADPEAAEADRAAERECVLVGDIRMPVRLAFSRNHMWLDIGESGSCHVGVDGFFAALLGSFEGLSYVTPAGLINPRIAFRVRGLDLHMVFPVRIHVTRVNSYLRARPEKLVSDPYGMGWLCEGVVPDAVALEELRAALLHQDEARTWMEHELRRLRAFERRAGQGAERCRGLMNRLPPDELLRLFNEFFAPYAARDRQGGREVGEGVLRLEPRRTGCGSHKGEEKRS
jgi:glycine cleavage system H lipoate-binding protein